MLSTSSATESFLKKTKIGLSNLEFRSNIPKWGGRVFFNNNFVEIVNTCTIDYFLFSIWIAWRLGPLELEGNQNELLQHLYEVIQHIENRDWDGAKSIWSKNVIKLKLSPSGYIDAWGTEMEMFIRFFSPLQEYTIIRTCLSSCERNNSQQTKQLLAFRSDNNNKISLFGNEKCRLCDKIKTYTIRFDRNPFIIIIEASLGFKTNIYDLPKELLINNKKYCLLMMTSYIDERSHFVSLFLINNVIYYVDDKPYYTLDKHIIPIPEITDFSQLQPSNCVYYLTN